MKILVVGLIAAVAVAMAFAETECERRRRLAKESNILVQIIPECDENGDFKEMQCHKDHSFCQCWNKEGEAISPPLRNLKHCECWKELAEIDPRVDGYIPACQKDGTYSRKQCWPSAGICWCVDEYGKKLTEPVRGEITC